MRLNGDKNLRFENHFRFRYKGNKEENASDRRNVSLIVIQPRDEAVSLRNFYSTTNHSSNTCCLSHIYVHNELTIDYLSLS